MRRAGSGETSHKPIPRHDFWETEEASAKLTATVHIDRVNQDEDTHEDVSKIVTTNSQRSLSLEAIETRILGTRIILSCCLY